MPRVVAIDLLSRLHRLSIAITQWKISKTDWHTQTTRCQKSRLSGFVHWGLLICLIRPSIWPSASRDGSCSLLPPSSFFFSLITRESIEAPPWTQNMIQVIMNAHIVKILKEWLWVTAQNDRVGEFSQDFQCFPLLSWKLNMNKLSEWRLNGQRSQTSHKVSGRCLIHISKTTVSLLKPPAPWRFYMTRLWVSDCLA